MCVNFQRLHKHSAQCVASHACVPVCLRLQPGTSSIHRQPQMQEDDLFREIKGTRQFHFFQECQVSSNVQNYMDLDVLVTMKENSALYT
jgi:hypothetical protein